MFLIILVELFTFFVFVYKKFLNNAKKKFCTCIIAYCCILLTRLTNNNLYISLYFILPIQAVSSP